jgi:Cd2+/Zn2+-exporting ATPase
MDVLIQVGGFTDVSIYIDGEVEGLTLPNMGDIVIKDDIHSYREIKNASQFNQFFSVYGLGLNIILSGAFWVICMIGELVQSWDHLKYAGLLSVLFGIPPVVVKAFRTIQRLHFDANCMMVIAAFGALALKEYDEAASVAFLFSISEYLEDKATRQARLALDSIVKLRPDHANLILSTGEIKIVPASILNIGSLVSVRTGDKIPTDGIIVEGSSEIDESSLTGESRPIDKCVNDVVSGGTINIGSTRLVVKTTSSVDDSAVSRLIRLVEEAQANRSPTELLVDNFAKSYTPVVLVAALFMCILPWILGLDKDVCRRWSLNGLIIIVISCPCALTISTPVTYAAGLAATAQRGIIVKGGSKLEALGTVKTVIFDKTGTLTEGKFHMVHIKCISESKSREEILKLLAIMEAPSSHPLATTIVQSVKNEGIQIPMNCNMKSHSILKGEGVTAYVDGRATYVGNTRLFKRLGWYKNLKEEFVSDSEQWDREGGTVGFLGMEGIGILAMFSVADKIRSEAKEVVSTLQNDGIEVIMLTGKLIFDLFFLSLNMLIAETSSSKR